MPAIETSAEVSECTITPKAYAFDTEHPWVSVDFSPHYDALACAVSLSFSSIDDLDRVANAIHAARQHFESHRAEHGLIEMPACETEVIR